MGPTGVGSLPPPRGDGRRLSGTGAGPIGDVAAGTGAALLPLTHRPPFPMKKLYARPDVAAHGTVDQITAVFGNAAQRDVLRNSNTVLQEGNLSISACAEVSGVCL